MTTPPSQLSTFGKPIRSPRTPTPSSLTQSFSYSDTFENVTQTQSVQYSDTFETDTKPEQTTIKTAKFTTIAAEIELGKTTPDLTRLSESFPTYSDTFETERASKDFSTYQDSVKKVQSDYSESAWSDSRYSNSEYTNEETRSYGTRTLESVAQRYICYDYRTE